MKIKCKPGDLAVVVNSECPCNLGRIVKIIETHDRRGDLVFSSYYGHVWLAEGAPHMTWYLGKKRYRRVSGPVPDSCLQPIRGDSPLLNDAQRTILMEKARLASELERLTEHTFAGELYA